MYVRKRKWIFFDNKFENIFVFFFVNCCVCKVNSDILYIIQKQYKKTASQIKEQLVFI